MKKHFIFSTLALFTSIAFAEEDDNHENSKVEELVQELFLSEIVYPQDANELQLTSGVQRIEEKEEGEDPETYFITPLLIEYGITDMFQLGIKIPTQYAGNVGVSGVGNIELESLYNFYNNKESGWAFSGIFGVSLPRLSNKVGEKGFVFEPALIGYKSFGRFALNLSAGIAIPTESENNSEVELDAAAIYNAGIFRPSLEFSAEFEDGKSALSILAGTTIILKNDLEVGFGVANGLKGESPEWQVFTTLTWEFEF